MVDARATDYLVVRYRDWLVSSLGKAKHVLQVRILPVAKFICHVQKELGVR